MCLPRISTKRFKQINAYTKKQKICTYVFYTAQRHADYVRDRNLKCMHSVEEMEQLLNLTYEVHTILDSLHIDHWLMYGSVFGAIRAQGPLAWDYDVDIGIRGIQFLKLKKTDIFGAFITAGLRVTDHVARNGLIGVSRPGWNLGVDVFTFYDYDGIMKRPGWASWLLFVNYELHHTFPSRLVKSPLPVTKFGFFNISVPREGNEILKYLYRFDWWKVVKPLSC
ncbi:uncharacterized protein LOC116306764 [Actinia tenebrosa]|uniref:Uncharacterized protein LOC116306764 n=1 Tax=Actinia tenebrosa TaxID=6105 RepID=A0A6P8IZT4_ACTTE|nr:uncharacterized protein LOC116306764 [Actinia tenebrosa]